VITGGTGALGTHVARMLLDDGAEHVLLVSRSGGAHDLGPRVTARACDVSDRAALAALLAEYPVNAVFHAAGVAQRVADPTLAEFAEIAKAKIAGAIHLDELLPALDAFVLFSSDATVIDRPGQAAYASANAFLDGLAQRRRARGQAATSIAWGAWDTGMVDGKLSAYLKAAGTPPMRPAQAIAALREILTRPDDNVIVATVTRPEPARPEPAKPEDPLGLVRTHVAELLGYADPREVTLTRTFDDLGFDSIGVIGLRDRLSSAVGEKLPTSMVYDHPTPLKLAEFLRARARPADVPVDVLLTTASADDVFDFIDKELGLA
jgi:NAD(P)-dependent dehydrogenase (short-subunit alcohol dehydrogenase family)